MPSHRNESNAAAVERTAYELCATGQFMEAYGFLNLARDKFISPQELSDIQDSLIEDFQGFRELM